MPVMRSVFYVPGNNESFIQKSPSLPADIITLDLEDSVPPAEKAKAGVLELPLDRIFRLAPVPGVNQTLDFRQGDVSGGAGEGRHAAEACVQGFLSDFYSTPDTWSVRTAGEKVLTALNRWLHGQGPVEDW